MLAAYGAFALLTILFIFVFLSFLLFLFLLPIILSLAPMHLATVS